MSHYIKIMLDYIFGQENFRNEVVWKRTNSPKAQTSQLGSQHDIVLWYSKTPTFTFNRPYSEMDEKYLKAFRYDDNDGRGPYQTVAIVAGGTQKYDGRREFEFKGITAPWLYSLENLEQWWAEGKIHTSKNGNYRLKKYLSESAGVPVSDLWMDVAPVQGKASQYPTQKPEALLERIIKASSNGGGE